MDLKIVIYACWIVFWVFWIGSAFSNKKTLLYRNKRNIVVRLLVLIIALIIFSPRISGSTLTNISWSHPLILRVIGVLMFVSGLSTAIWARRHLGKNWGTPMSIKANPDLITSGPYKYIRHPIYSGILLASLGTALAVSYFWLAIMLISGAYFIYSATVEEKDMTKQFPYKYPDYKKKSKMLIPYIF